jgi:hypothetical protein
MGRRPPGAPGGKALFREVNDRIYEVAAQLSDRSSRTRAEFVCECGAPDCCRQISMTLEEYEALRALRGRYAVALEHESQEPSYTRSRESSEPVVEQDGAASG